VVAVAYVATGGVGAIASRQKRVGFIRNQVVPLTRGEEVLKVHQLPHSCRLQIRLPTARESPCDWVVPVTRGEEVLNKLPDSCRLQVLPTACESPCVMVAVHVTGQSARGQRPVFLTAQDIRRPELPADVLILVV